MTLSSTCTRPRLVRAAAVATAATLVTALAGAGTAVAAEPVNVQATTDTGVVQVTLTLPQAVPGLPNPIELTILGTDGTAVRGGAQDAAETNSYLLGGSLVDDSPLSPLFAPLSRTLTADLASPAPQTATGIEVPDNPLGLDLSAGTQSVAVQAPTRGSTASSELADAGLGTLRSLGLGAVLDPVFAGLNTAVTTLVTSASPLTQAVSTLPSLPSIPIPNPLQPVVGGPATIPTPTLGGPALAGSINELPARVEALQKQLLDGAVLSLSALDTSQAITPTATSATSTGKAQLGTAELFGGLVTVKATQASATAKAALTKSDASSDASATLVEVTVADSFGELLSAVASDKGITAGLLDGTLGQTLDPTVRPTIAAVDTALNAVLAQLTGLLEALGGGAQLIQQGTVTKTVSADGRRAEASASPALVSLGLPVAPNLVSLAIGAVDTVAVVSPAVAPTQAPAPEPVPTALPRTGGSDTAPLAAVVLLAAAGAAVVLRRRFS